MRVLCFWVLLSFLHVRQGFCQARDGPIDWEDIPGGGPSTLRVCARYAFDDAARAGGVRVVLGCDVISCMCRSDLIETAHNQIEHVVEVNCGTDARVDIEQAIEVYNRFCASNGYPIPGYTFVSTTTVRPTTRLSTVTDDEDPTPTPTPTPTRTPTPVLDPDRETVTEAGFTATLTMDAGVCGCPDPTTTVTILAGSTASSSRGTVCSWPWLQLVCLIWLIHFGLMAATADEVPVVTYTEDPGQPAGSSVFVTTLGPQPTAPDVVVETVTEGVPRETMDAPIETQQGGEDGDSNVRGSTTLADEVPEATENTSGTPEKNDEKSLSTLETVGIVIGIVLGVITAITTICMCSGGHGGWRWNGQALQT